LGIFFINKNQRVSVRDSFVYFVFFLSVFSVSCYEIGSVHLLVVVNISVKFLQNPFSMCAKRNKQMPVLAREQNDGTDVETAGHSDNIIVSAAHSLSEV